MRNIIFGLLYLLVTGPAAIADDTGVIGISVKDLQFVQSLWDQREERSIESPMRVDDSLSYVVKAKGKEAAKLMRILPPVQSVLTTMYPRFAPTYNANFRSLEITGAKGQPAVTLYCEGGALKFSDRGDQPPKFIPFADGAHCTIRTAVTSEDDNVSYTFNPAKMICGR